MRRVAYLTDVEGRWDKLEEFCSGNPIVRLDDGRIRVAEGAVFVFGGDAIDRGPAARRLVTTLAVAKIAQPDRVVLLAGNRDINKLRLVRELTGHPPARVPVTVVEKGQGALLSFIFTETMGAKDALGHRCSELQAEGRSASPDDAAQSFLEDLAPSGALTRYLAKCQLAFREGDALFLHGGVTSENLRVVPGRAERAATVDAWIAGLNEFYSRSLEDFVERRLRPDGTPGWAALVEYQAPKRGTRQNQASVVYARPTTERGEPVLPSAEVVRALRDDGVSRVLVGHTPSGDCPAVLRDEQGFSLVLADNSYGRIEGGPRVLLDHDKMEIVGMTELDSGAKEVVAFELSRDDDGPIGKRDIGTGRLVKARLARGDYLTFRMLEGYQVEQTTLTEEAIEALTLEPPR